MSVFFLRRGMFSESGDSGGTSDLVGTTWLFEYGEDGTFTVPETGTYSVELHGGGGGGIYSSGTYNGSKGASSGGGSGEILELELVKDDIISITVGAGGLASAEDSYYGGTASSGGTTTFGDHSLAGGSGGTIGNNSSGGNASGSKASAGSFVSGTTVTAEGGQGNTSDTGQLYGDGGSASNSGVNDGQHGAVIITFLGTDSSGEDEPESTNLINFTIDGKSYQAESGMTWAEWLNSTYNTNGFTDNYGTVLSSDGNHTVIMPGTTGHPLATSDSIIANEAYEVT